MNLGTIRCITRTLSVVLASESAKKSQGYDALTIQNVKWYIIIFIFCCNETFVTICIKIAKFSFKL